MIAFNLTSSVFWSFVLRVSSAGLKFLMLLYLARVLSVEDLGLFALISAAVMIYVQIMGAEFHSVTSRVITASSEKITTSTIQMQVAVQLGLHLAGLPIIFLIMENYLNNFAIALVVTSLVFFEHFSIEFSRFTQFLIRPFTSAFLSFLRSGAWVLGLFIMIELNIYATNVLNILITWTLFSAIATLVGAVCLKEHFQSFLLLEFSWSAITKMFKGSAPFFFIAVMASLSANFDKFIIKHSIDLAAVGVFYFFFSIASSLSLFVTFGAGMIYGPKCIQVFRTSGFQAFKKMRNEYAKVSLIYGSFGLFFASITIVPVLHLLGKAHYSDYLPLYFICLAVHATILVADFYHLDMYARGMDKELLTVAFGNLIFVAVAQYALINLLGLYGAGVASLVSALFLLISRKAAFGFALRRHPNLLETYRA
jgi:O-antigen/teichoic acid export membrane protein